MPAGCDFTCMNEECEQYKSGFVINAQWPMGKIELVLNAPNVKEKEGFREGLVKLKDEGQKYACITYPNVSRIETVAYQLQLWCPSCPRIWKHDVVLSEDCPTYEDALKKAKEDGEIREHCPLCYGELMGYDDILEKGILCPFCKKDLQQNRWMAKEVNTQDTYNGGK